MAFPQLAGQTTHTSTPNTGPAIFVTVIALAGVLAVAAWRLIPHQVSAGPQPPVVAVAAVPPIQPTPEPTKSGPTDDQQLHLAHAEHELVAAAEQLNTARHLLAALSPDLNRSYLQYEKRRADNAWTACDNAQRAIEEAREHLKVIALTGKDK